MVEESSKSIFEKKSDKFSSRALAILEIVETVGFDKSLSRIGRELI